MFDPANGFGIDTGGGAFQGSSGAESGDATTGASTNGDFIVNHGKANYLELGAACVVGIVIGVFIAKVV
ncbi:hypothetical protein HR060_10740 [Catenovulum sp. SM1970]|uniref:hypothetical protein n=1 Tax=Marinifaba aquimaris TaxID=2741323 RepID=UPI0015726501|nr:hypothetical protein [Marinifaba aquimaris]NTS77341.1 hypothetical protein [Marinifaba aquimaris]